MTRNSSTRASISRALFASIVLCLAIPLASAQATESKVEANAEVSTTSTEATAEVPTASAEAPPSDNAATTPALAEVVVNGDELGSMELSLDSSQQPVLPPELLRAALSDILEPELLATLAVDGKAMPAADLKDAGLDLSYDPNELKLSIIVPPRLMRPVDLGADGTTKILKGEAKLQEARFSALLGANLDLDGKYRIDSTGGSFGPSCGLDLTPAFRAFGLVAEGEADLDYADGFSATIPAARILKDFPEFRSRMALGIAALDPQSFQSSLEMLGLSFSRQAIFPGTGRATKRIIDQFVLEREAQVEVEVNGAIMKKLELAPGTYRLSDLPLSSGLNEVTVRIREEGKEEKTATLGLPFDSEILAEGDADYSLNLGVDKSDLTKPVGAGFFSMGVASNIEAEADFEGGYGGGLAGLGAAWASPAGTIGGAAALAFPFSAGSGYSLAVGSRLYWRYAYPRGKYIPKLGAAVEFRSPGFSAPRSTILTDAAASYPIWSFSAQASEALPIGGSVSLFGSCKLESATFAEASSTMGFMLPVLRNLSIFLSGGVDYSVASGVSPRLSALITFIPPNKRSIQYRQDITGGSQSLDATVGLNDPNETSLGFSGRGFVGSEIDRDYSFSGRTRTKYVDLSSTIGCSSPADDSYEDYKAAISASSSLVFADGCFGIAKSGGDALALLVPASALGAEKIELMAANGAKVSTESAGTKVISGLTPYQKFVAAIEMPDSSPDVRPSPASVEFTPEYRSVTIVRVKAASSVSIKARLVDEDASPRKNISGDLIDAEGKTLPSGGTFTDEEGIFECFGLIAGPASIRWSDGSLSRFEVPEGEPGSSLDIGDVGSEKPEVDGGSK
jgi:P pilus assembly protein, porin PapC